MIIALRRIKKYFGAVHAVDDVDLSVQRGQTLSIVGESGCGKTTLAKIMVGLLRPDEGKVIVDGKIQMVFQDPYNSLDPLWTVRRILNEAFYVKSLKRTGGSPDGDPSRPERQGGNADKGLPHGGMGAVRTDGVVQRTGPASWREGGYG